MKYIKIIFVDELSLMDTPKSDFIKALENFWNGLASCRDDIILIVCASAKSWMLKKSFIIKVDYTID